MILQKNAAVTLLLTLLASSVYGNGSLPMSENDRISIFSWVREEAQTVNRGFYGIIEVNDIKTDDSFLTIGAATEIQGMPNWLDFVTNRSAPTVLTLETQMPSSVTQYSKSLETATWLTSISLSVVTGNQTCRFVFPLPANGTRFQKYDYFIVRVNDTLNLQFNAVEDTVIIGSFLNTRHVTDPEKWLCGRDAIRVYTDTTKALGISAVDFNGEHRTLLNTYLGIDLDRFDSDAESYGIEFLDSTINASPLIVSNFQVDGDTPLLADELYQIDWDIEDYQSVDRCSLFVSLDNGVSWNTISVLHGSAYAYNWTVPPVEADSAILKVHAYDGLRFGQAQSATFPIRRSIPFQLSARALTDTTIELAWDHDFIPPNAQAVYIARSNVSLPQTAGGPGIDTTRYTLEAAGDTIGSLEAESKYYFRAFILNAQGEFEPAGPQAADSAFTGDNIPPENLCTLNVSRISADSLRLSWKVSALQNTDASLLGIWYQNARYPSSPHDNDNSEVGTYPVTDSNMIISGLSVNSSFYFSLFVSDSNGNWSETTESSRAKILLNEDAGQPLTLVPGDTANLFNGAVKITAIPHPGDTLYDTLEIWHTPDIFNGFRPLSSTYVLRSGAAHTDSSFLVSIQCENIPSEMNVSSIKIFQFDANKGIWEQNAEPGTFDSQSNRITARLYASNKPFAALIDTVSPVVTIKADVNKVYSSREKIIDTLSISDNAGNLSMKLYAGPGSEYPVDFSLYATKLSNDADAHTHTFKTIIPPYVADECSGLRAFATITDGTHVDTIDLSRRIHRSEGNCDNSAIQPSMWTPILVTAKPDNNSIESLFKRATGKNDWSYNTTQMRLLQWSSMKNDWLEYSSTNAKSFELIPGKLLWVKTNEPVTLDFGPASTSRLNDTTRIAIAPASWADFGNPYAFNITMRDVLKATGEKANVEVYTWKTTGTNYRSEPLYISTMPGLDDSLVHLINKVGYTAFNPTNDTVHMHIPSTCANISLHKTAPTLSKTVNSVNKGSLKITTTDEQGSSLNPVFCGFSKHVKKIQIFSIPPSLNHHYATVVNTEDDVNYGHIVTPLVEDGAHYKIEIHNNNKQKSVFFSTVDDAFGMAKTMNSGLYDPNEHTWAAYGDTFSIEVDGNSSKSFYAVAGSENYLSQFGSKLMNNRLFLNRVFPNPFKGRFHISFTVPFDGLEKLDAKLYNLRGQQVWNKSLKPSFAPGINTLIIKDDFSAGVYILRISAVLHGGSKTKIFSRRITCAK